MCFESPGKHIRTQASARLYYLINTVVEARAVVAADADGAVHAQRAQEAAHRSPVVAACMAALSDDLNTPAALAGLSQTLREMNDALYTRKGRKQAGRVERLANHVAVVQHVLGVVGVAADHQVLEDLRRTALVRCVVATELLLDTTRLPCRGGVTEEDVLGKLEERKAARDAKDYESSDRVRDWLAQRGVIVMDTPDGSFWRPAAGWDDDNQ